MCRVSMIFIIISGYGTERLLNVLKLTGLQFTLEADEIRSIRRAELYSGITHWTIVTLRHELGRVQPQAKPRESPKGQVGSKFLILGFCFIWPQIGPIYHISKRFAQIRIANRLILLFNTQVQYTERDNVSHCKSNISVATF